MLFATSPNLLWSSYAAIRYSKFKLKGLGQEQECEGVAEEEEGEDASRPRQDRHQEEGEEAAGRKVCSG